MKLAFFRNKSCQRREQEEFRIKEWVTVNGHTITNNLTEADFIVMTTCAYDKENYDSAIDQVNRLRQYRDKTIITGCLPDIDPTFDLTDFIVARGDEVFNHINLLEHIKSIHDMDESSMDTSTGVFISRGCLGHCKYCGIRYARGSLKSVEPDIILTHVIKKWELGLTPVLLAEDSLAYGKDSGSSIVSLLNLLKANKVNSTDTVILDAGGAHWFIDYYDDLSIHLLDGFISRIALGIQSFSTKVLKEMDRPHDYDPMDLGNKLRYLANERMNKTGQDYTNQLDLYLIVGYPTETDKDFNMTSKAVTIYLESSIPFTAKEFKRHAVSLAPQPDLDPLVIQRRSETLYTNAGMPLPWIHSTCGYKIYDCICTVNNKYNKVEEADM